MTPADAIAALRRAFPAVADEGVERFRRELEPPPKWCTLPGILHGWELRDGPVIRATVVPAPHADRWRVWTERMSMSAVAGPDYYAATLDDAMRAAERALGLPECEVVR